MQRYRKLHQSEALLAMRTRQCLQYSASGFTLIELMVTLAVAAILLVIAVPSFVTFQRNSELTSATNALVGAISAARGEALKRGMSAVVVPATGSNWTNGWSAFIDQNNNQVLDAGEPVILQQSALATYFSASGQGTASGSTGYIMFDPSGYAKTSTATFQASTLTIARNDLSGATLQEQTRIIVIAKTGRVRSCRPSTDATCTPQATE